MPPPPFEYLGPYKIGSLIGRGGMGDVYAGTHARSGDKVAVKLIKAHIADEPKFRRRFDKEIRAMKMLNHPGIVRLIGYGEEEGQLFYSMELVKGTTLQARIRKEKRLGWLETIDIAIQICAALKHAHDIGITHRDLKPANLLLSPDGKVKLVDFGIPKLFGDSTDQTAAGSVLGTPDYMAPEQARGSSITPRTDLYALGSVMYAMMSGRAPFKGKNSTEVIHQLVRERPVPLEMLCDDMPDELAELIHQLLEKAPEDRPPTALAVMNRLKSMRVGLKKESTMMDDSDPATKVLSDSDLPSGPSGTAIHASDTGRGESGQGTHAVRTNARTGDEKASRQGTVRSPRADAAKKDAAEKQVSPDDKTFGGEAGDLTIASSPGGISSAGTVVPRKVYAGVQQATEDEPDTEVPAEMPSHFNTVDEADRHSGYFELDSDEGHSSPLARALSIAGLIAIAAFLFIVAFRVTRKPSADQLYADVIPGEKTNAAEVFLRRFPNDPRHDEVQQWLMGRRLEATIKRLDTKQRLGISPLDAPEESFARAIRLSETAPDQAAVKLRQWLEVFDTSAPSTSGDAIAGASSDAASVASAVDELANQRLSQMIELARYFADHFKSRGGIAASNPRVDPRAMELIHQIQATAKSAVSPEEKQAAVRRMISLIETFSDQPWARPAIDEAKRQLTQMQ